MQFCKIFLMSALISGVLCSSAISAPPKFVWRIDKRAPYLIFNQGFSSWGNNTNVYAHISGSSCESPNLAERNSGFISTAANQQWAIATASQMAINAPSENVFLYRIRADNSFYNAELSLQSYAERNPQAEVSEVNFGPARLADEYITPLQISNGNIESVLVFSSDDGVTVQTYSEVNENYISSNTRASAVPYGGSSDSNSRLTWIRYFPLIGACMYPRSELKNSEILQYFYPLEASILSLSEPAL